MNAKISLLICGSLAYDELFTYAGNIRDHLPTGKRGSLYANIRARGPLIRRGGCGGNLAWTTTLFSIPTALFSWVGGDGGEYIQFLNAHGIDTSQILVVPEQSTPRAVLLSDKRQDQFLIFSSQEIPIGWKQVETKNFTFAVITAGIPKKTKEIIEKLKTEKIPYIIDPGKFILDIAPEDLLFCLTGADTIVINSYEKELLLERTGKTWSELSVLSKCMVVTLGENGSVVEISSQSVKIPAVHPPSLLDPYGAGDAFLAGYAVGRILQYTPVWSARIGSVTASFALEEEGAQTYTFTGFSFLKRFENSFGLPEKTLSQAYAFSGILTGPFAQ